MENVVLQQKIIMDLENLNTYNAEGCLACNQKFTLGDMAVLEVMPGKTSLLLGAHFSIAKGLHNALFKAQAYNCSALQIFTKNAHTWKERALSRHEIDLFDQARERTGIKAIASHTSYLINLATYERKNHDLSCKALKHELFRSSMLGIPFVVLHPGAHKVWNRTFF
jgi:endonuclease IV